ncbi:hypothetical protein SAMN05421503_0115 [Terribacillus aidingensis]|uniref:Bacteriocin (Lactococcin_972) n=1 Tax=Terribacillus aidingensis TaxID=586416 RepID=A0A285N0K9_9BACI|nr:hypothetical protein [Terribacillus aidingensis]SNZ02463.1 hypothetical protein SAMN05421503_0115 [Terribacillus aidingensis]
MSKMKKGLAGALLAGVIVGGLSGGVSASSSGLTENGGSEIIESSQGVTESYVKDTQSGFSTNATSGEISGGYWIRGKRDGRVVSEYKHYQKEGRASVTNGAGYHDDGGWKAKNVWSKADLDWSFWGTNKSYYDYR